MSKKEKRQTKREQKTIYLVPCFFAPVNQPIRISTLDVLSEPRLEGLPPYVVDCVKGMLGKVAPGQAISHVQVFPRPPGYELGDTLLKWE